MTVAEKLKSWLDEIGADGLFDNVYQSSFIPKEALRVWEAFRAELVPAFRHADGSYHTEKEIGDEPCLKCPDANGDWCKRLVACDAYKHWLAHKEETK